MMILLWTLFFCAGVGFLLWQLWGRFRLLLVARRDDGRSYASGTWGDRIKNSIVYGFLQKKFFIGEQPAGWMHIAVFWGFCVLLFQVITMFGRGWVAEFKVPFLTNELLGGPYAASKEVFEIVVTLAVVGALIRWTITKPRRLFGILPAEEKLYSHSHAEAIIILSFIFTIMLSGILYDAAHIFFLANDPLVAWEATWQPVSRWVSTLFGGDQGLATTVGRTAWWVHNLVILTFVNLLPRSKHFHIITAIPNVFFGRVTPKGRLAKRDFTSETPLFGRSQANQFTWKQVLDMFSCTECGRCSSFCPAAATGKPLAPRQFLLNLRDHVYQLQPTLLEAKADTQYDVVVGEGKAVSDDVVWSCVECRACEEACPVNIEYVDKIVDIRQHLVQEASRFPEELGRAFKGMETNSNPWGISSSERGAWAEGLGVPLVSEKKDFEYLYYVGCGGSFDSNNRKATQAFVRLLKKGGVNFAVLGNDELCNGDSARRLGNEYLFQSMAGALVNRLKEHNVQKILVNCPHCFNTLKNEYPDFGGEWQVEHAAAVVGKLVSDGKIKLDGEFKKDVVYHDSCFYGRYNDIYDEPRNLLENIEGLNLKEMYFCKREGTCCGAGGGRMWMEERKDQRVNVMRTEQALEKKPDVVATSCPYCRIMIGSGINEKGLADQVRVADVMELVAEHCN
ncbi:MAG: (Fe-S)-binding protein [Deltaproteobacteria bacterium]|nr:(Fe-S)-binding protein [Deltaproteobacteria bacterium]